MDKERLHKTLAGNPRSKAEQRRLVAYSAVALLILGFYLFNRDRTTAPPEAVVPSAALEEPKVAPPLAQVDRALLADVSDETSTDRARLEPQATAHLLHQASQLVYGDLEQLGLVPADREELEERSAGHRGDAVYVLGELLWLEPLTDSLGYRVRGEVRDEQGRSWNFLVVTEPYGVSVGDIVKVQGFFLKNCDVQRPDRSLSSGPLIVAEELLRSSYRIEPVTELRPDLFLRVRDYDLTEASRPLESPEFYELLSYVREVPVEALFPAGTTPEEHRPIALMNSTALYRGKPVRVSGLLAAVQEVPLGPRGENPLGIPFIWNIWLSSYGGATLVISFEKPEGLVLKQDVVDVDGLYFRRFAYENQLGQPYTAAVVLAKRMTRYVAPESSFSPLLMKLIVGIVVGAVLLAWLMARRDRGEASAARQKRMVRLKKLASLPGALHRAPAPPGDARGGTAAATSPDGGDPAPPSGSSPPAP